MPLIRILKENIYWVQQVQIDNAGNIMFWLGRMGSDRAPDIEWLRCDKDGVFGAELERLQIGKGNYREYLPPLL